MKQKQLSVKQRVLQINEDRVCEILKQNGERPTHVWAIMEKTELSLAAVLDALESLKMKNMAAHTEMGWQQS